MAGATFLRWPVRDGIADDGIRAPIAAADGAGSGWALRSMIEPAEGAWFAAGPGAPGPAVPGAARYVLEQVSDTGPAAEPFGVLMLVAFDVPAAIADEVDRWYDREHIGLLMKADGWLRARRYRVLSHRNGPRWTSMAFHELRDIAVMDSPERAFARSTAWRAELEEGDWFRAAGRGVFRPLA